jgi:hypothetical protein
MTLLRSRHPISFRGLIGMAKLMSVGSTGKPPWWTLRKAGMMIAASCPSEETRDGSVPHTSAKPPVLAKGTASVVR